MAWMLSTEALWPLCDNQRPFGHQVFTSNQCIATTIVQLQTASASSFLPPSHLSTEVQEFLAQTWVSDTGWVGQLLGQNSQGCLQNPRSGLNLLPHLSWVLGLLLNGQSHQ